jgi:arabinofuranan 3-O-arabinosyltransferase
LVLGQSDNAGWEATVDGTNVGGSTLVDGYANGWLVHPPSGSFHVTLRWTPQQKVWIAIGMSAFALVLCLVLALRRRRSPAPPDDEEPPAFADPLVATGTRASTVRVLVGALAVAVVGAVLSAWWVGLVAGALVAVVVRWPRARLLITVGAPLALAACALYVIVQQHRYGYPSDLDWPPQFTRINEVAWLAVVLLLADVVVERIRHPGTSAADGA